jgi:hypothetical protein
MDPSYIGDGVYVHHDEFQIWLTTTREDGREETIALEPMAFVSLVRYAQRLWPSLVLPDRKGFDRDKRRIHMAGLFGGGMRTTWCGRRVDDDQLPILGTDREADCVACARSVQARGHAARWSYDYQKRWKSVLGEAAS